MPISCVWRALIDLEQSLMFRIVDIAVIVVVVVMVFAVVEPAGGHK